MTELLSQYGSFRRLCEAYWKRELSVEHERILEEGMPVLTIAAYKPIEAHQQRTETVTVMPPNGKY